MRLTREPVDAEWLEVQLERLERLVVDGDTLATVSLLAETMRGAERPAPELLPTDL